MSINKEDKDFKEYIVPTKKEKQDIIEYKRFEMFEIIPNVEKLRLLREEFIKMLKTPKTFKIVSNKPNWFFYNKGVYVHKNGFFEFGIVPLSSDNQELLNTFITYGPTKNQVKAIKHNNEVIFVYTPSTIDKCGITYKVSPSILINEFIYNLVKIQNRDFDAITKEDLSDYKPFFKVCDEPYSMVSEDRIEDLYRIGDISKEEYTETISKYEREAKLVKTLK